jgi:hypothetical protein
MSGVSSGTPATSPYNLLALVRERLGLEAARTGHDQLLSRLIEAAQAFIEGPEGAGRRFESSSPSSRHFDALVDVDGLTLRLDYDLAQVTQIFNGDGAEIPAGQYVTEPRNESPIYAIRLKRSAEVAWAFDEDPEDAIEVRGHWAYSVTPPANIVQACIDLTVWLYRRRDSSDADRAMITPDGITILPSAVPGHIMATLRSYRRRM